MFKKSKPKQLNFLKQVTLQIITIIIYNKQTLYYEKITFIIFAFMYLIINAQWSNDTSENLLVVNDSSDEVYSISTTNGNTYVVYWKVVAAPIYYELRLQVLDTLGNKQLGDDGILVSDTIPMSSYTLTSQLAIDANNNLLIGVTGSSNFQGYSYKLDINGNHLWDANGVNTNGVGFSVTFLPLTTGETIINWDADDKGLMQKYDVSGNAIWNTPQSVIIGTSETSPASLYELSNGDFINIFHKKASYGISSTLYAQRYNSNGIEQWSNAVQLSNNSTVFNRLYSGTQDGDVVYLGYSSSANNRFDSYLQRINPDGTLPWGVNGIDFDTNQTNFEQDTQITFFEGSSYIWSICTYTNTSQTESG